MNFFKIIFPTQRPLLTIKFISNIGNETSNSLSKIYFSKLRHNFDVFSLNFHHRFIKSFTKFHQLPVLFVPPKKTEHSKKYFCLIDSGFSKRSFCAYSKPSYCKCIDCCIRRNFLFIQLRKMVWISDLDNPQVFFFIFFVS
jgi:hypothetical protein